MKTTEMKINLTPFRNVKSTPKEAFQWNAENDDPQFLIENLECIRGRIVRFSFRIFSDNQHQSPCILYVNCGHGFSERSSVRLKVGSDGVVDQQIEFTASLVGLRFDPISHNGSFSIFDLCIDLVDHLNGKADRIVISDDKACNRTCPGIEFSIDYAQWIDINEPSPSSYERYRKKVPQRNDGPLISVAMPTFNTPPQFLRKAIESVVNQVYEKWELCIADDCSTTQEIRSILFEYASSDDRIKIVFREKNGHISAASNTAIGMATGDYIGFLDHDDELHPLALLHIAIVIQSNPDATLFFSDEDKISIEGDRSEPYFKSKFNYDLFLSQNMICHFSVYTATSLQLAGGFRVGFEGAQDYDLALRVLDLFGEDAIHHIPHVLYHWRMIPQSTASDHEAKPYAASAAARAIAEHLARKQIFGKVEEAPLASGFHRVVYSLPEKLPLVEIIIPTRDASKLLCQCIDSIRNKTTYPNYLITIIDNGSIEQATFDLFTSYARDVRIRVLRDDSPFNYSAINNRVALASVAELVCLMNNDIEVIEDDWLTEMVSLGILEGVGAVGAKLLYPDKTVQHSGVILGIGGVAGHSHKFFPCNAPGYFCRNLLRNSMSAVTGACLLVRADTYKQVGGLDEKLVVAFNDVDFCLRVREAGYRNIWTPYALLYHHESASRGYEDTPEKKARFEREIAFIKERWGSRLIHDPCYSPNLTLDSENFAIAMHSRATKLFL